LKKYRGKMFRKCEDGILKVLRKAIKGFNQEGR
jgi:hypothetical protein